MSKFAIVQFDTNFTTGDTNRNASVLALQRTVAGMSATSSRTEMLSTGVWLIHLQKDLPLLGRICAAADSAGVPYRLLLLEQEPEWISYGDWK